MATVSRPSAVPPIHGVPAPLHGGPLGLLRFMRAHGMLNAKYALLIGRWAWLKLRWGRRLQTDGLCFVGPGVRLEIGAGAVLRLGRWSWLRHGTKGGVDEGVWGIGGKTGLGPEGTNLA